MTPEEPMGRAEQAPLFAELRTAKFYYYYFGYGLKGHELSSVISSQGLLQGGGAMRPVPSSALSASPSAVPPTAPPAAAAVCCERRRKKSLLLCCEKEGRGCLRR
jgi:hypothetical protein